MSSNVISDKLSEGTSTIEVEAKPSDRELEFAKVTEITESIRKDFLANKDMTIEEAVAYIQEGLAEIVPPALPESMPGMPMGMPGGMPPEGSGDIGSVLGAMPPKL